MTWVKELRGFGIKVVIYFIIMKHIKRINLDAIKTEVGDGESEPNPRNTTYMSGASLVKCFVCDKEITRGGISLMMGCVPYSKTGFPKKIGELMGDGFMVIISEDDLLCKKCTTMLNYVDKLEVDLEISKKELTSCLKTKYNLLDSEETEITTSDIENITTKEEVKESPQFDVSIFLQSTDDSIQSGCGKSNIKGEEGIETVIKSEKNNSEYSGREEGTNDSELLAETLKISTETEWFKCSECNKSFENRFEAEEHLQSHVKTLYIEEVEAESGDNDSTGKQNQYQCHMCTFQTTNTTFLEKHFQKHLSKPIYQCSLCPKRFKSRTYLLKHVSIHCVFKCSFCSQKFNESAKLLKHLVVHKHNGSKLEQKTVGVHYADLGLEDRQQQFQSIAHNSDFEKKEDLCLKLLDIEIQSNVEDSNMQKGLETSQGIGVENNKIEELMAKLHADDIQCNNNEGNSISENITFEDSTTNDCQKAEEPRSCFDNENREAFTEVEDNSITCQYLAGVDVFEEEGSASEQQNTDNTVIVEHFSHENANSIESLQKEEPDELPNLCSVCGLKCESDCELTEHMKTHQTSENRTYECYICCRKFTTQVNLTRHLGKHGTSFKRICCKLCSEEIIDETHLSQHMRKAHRAFLQCFYCSQEFTTKKELEQHELAHPENSTHRCNLCKKRFVTEIRLKTHLKNVHNDVPGDEIYKCNVCSKSLTTFYNLKRHLINHEKSERNVKCEICFEILTDRLHLRQHMEDMHANAYKCAFCQQAFSNRKMCRTHELMHPERYVYKCDSCPSSFTDKSGLEKHNSIFHRDPHCRFCGKEITVPTKLLNHERRHEMYKNKFPCKHCSKVFRTPSGLKYHMSTHTGKYAVYCEICGRGLHSEILLEEHMASHTKEARYTCDVCGRNFSARSTYRLHRKWHDDPLPYRCKFCNRRFKHTSVMAVHIRRSHTGERPYKCPHCPHTFSVSSTLHKHIILHTKNYPFICKYCNKGFTARSKIALHMAKAHDDYEMMNSKPPPCEYKMALKPSELPSAPAEDDPPESSCKDISGEKFEETVIEEQIVEAGQTIFLFQEDFV